MEVFGPVSILCHSLPRAFFESVLFIGNGATCRAYVLGQGFFGNAQGHGLFKGTALVANMLA